MDIYAITVLVGFTFGVLYTNVQRHIKRQNCRKRRNDIIKKRDKIFDRRMRLEQEFPQTTRFEAEQKKGETIFKGDADLMSNDEFRCSLQRNTQKTQRILRIGGEALC